MKIENLELIAEMDDGNFYIVKLSDRQKEIITAVLPNDEGQIQMFADKVKVTDNREKP